MLKPWLILGPIFENVSQQVPGLTLYETPDGTGGMDLMKAAAGDLGTFIAACEAVEGKTEQVRDQNSDWKLLRGPEEFYTWGGYFTQNHLGCVVLAASVTPEAAGMHQWHLRTRMAGEVLVAVNGTVVFQTGVRPATIVEGQEEADFRFEAMLAAGENRVCVGLLRIGRMARVGFHLDVDGAVTARVGIGSGEDRLKRSLVEEQIHSMWLERDIVYPEHAVRLHLGLPPIEGAPLFLKLSPLNGKAVLFEHKPQNTGVVELCQGAQLENGAYELLCEWRQPDGKVLTTIRYHLQKTSPTAPMEGYEHMAQRKQQVLEFYAEGWDARPLWNQLARYALGRYDQIDEGVIRAACTFIAGRNDTADFVMQGILRLLYWERKTAHLSEELRDLMKATVLGFKYWVDEPGDTVMWMDSENHRFLFHTAEWLAGQLYPLEEFSNSRQRGLFHALKGRTYATEWMRERGLYGFDEWHSNSYYPASMVPLFNVYDFAPYEDHKLRLLAGAVLDSMFFNLAADSFEGVLGTTHGRTYKDQLIHPDFEGTAGLNWLAFGRGVLRHEGGAMAPVALATSQYRLPPILAKIAADRTAVVEARVRQGIASKGNMEFYPRNSDRFADFRVYRTPDYLMCGLQDYRVGEYEPAVHVAQVTLGNRAVIFWSCPYTTNEGGGLRPDYWSGNTCMPRVVQQGNLMGLSFQLSHDAWMSHCFFETARFDEVRYHGCWAFARVGAGYVGIWSQNGYVVGHSGQYAGRELICEADQNTWLVEGGRAADWGTFEAFCSALAAAPIEVKEGVVAYTSPSAGLFITGWKVSPSLNGQAIQLHEYPLVDSIWAHADFGGGGLTIRYGGETHEVYFQQ